MASGVHRRKVRMRQRLERALGGALALVPALGRSVMALTVIDAIHFGLEWVLVVMLATELYSNWRRRDLDERVSHIEDFLRLAMRPRSKP